MEGPFSRIQGALGSLARHKCSSKHKGTRACAASARRQAEVCACDESAKTRTQKTRSLTKYGLRLQAGAGNKTHPSRKEI